MEEQTFNLADELERKTLDVLSRIVSDFEQGAISQPSARFALRILFDTTSGLVGDEAFYLVSAASEMINAEPDTDMAKRFFVNQAKQEIVLLTYQFGEAQVGLKRGSLPKDSRKAVWERESKATFETETNPFEAARVRFKGYAESLLRHGFMEIK